MGVSSFSEIKNQKSDSVRVVCSYVFDEFAKQSLEPGQIEDASFCSHLNVHRLVIQPNHQVAFENRYKHPARWVLLKGKTLLLLTHNLFCRLNELMKIKNQNKNLKFLVSIGNESDAQAYDAICSSSQSSSQFIDSILDIVQLYELDGVNFNFKFDLDDQEASLSFLFKQNLMQMLRVGRAMSFNIDH